MKKGFTLSEVMISTAVLAMLMTGVMAFYIQSVKGTYVAAQRLDLGSNIRKFNDELVRHASRANECILYLSSVSADRDGAEDRQEIDTAVTPAAHPAGDFVVFVYYEFPKVVGEARHRIRQIVGYSVQRDATGIGTVRKVVIPSSAMSNADKLLPVETLLTNKWGNGAVFSDFLLNVRGLAPNEKITIGPNAGPRLFYLSDKRAIAVSGQIFQSNSNRVTKDWKTYTESFNFVVTPRS